jgi:hypothetical protein
MPGWVSSFVVLMLALAPGTAGADVATGWAGIYEYHAQPSRTFGGSPVTMTYRMVIHPSVSSTATLRIQGYQTDETLICDVSGSESAITLLFRSYANGSTRNVYGVEEFTKAEPLLRLEYQRLGSRFALITEWEGVEPPDRSVERRGEYFHRLKSNPVP